MNRTELLKEKHAGILLPLFSMRSQKDWGIGDISSFGDYIEFFFRHNFDIVEILPINDLAPGINCPYTALSGFAIDPVYISVEDLDDLNENKNLKKSLLEENRAALNKIKKSRYILYDDIRKIKYSFLWNAYQSFIDNHLKATSERANQFSTFLRQNDYWLNDYALFRTIKDKLGWISWTNWPVELKNKGREAIERFSAENKKQIDFFKYVQWQISSQWERLKKKAEKLNVKIYGDLPFMVNQESADVWSRQSEFIIDVSIGAPPDAFSKNGQDWGLPACNWWEVEKKNFEWWRQKVKRAQDLYHIYRLDHMVGFFRTWIVPHNKNEEPHFDLKDENEQIARGKRFLKAMLSASWLLPIAEDLGLIPPYVGETLKEMNVPEYKVMRWEKRNGKYVSPEDYYPVSCATTSTHDTTTLKEWWLSLKKKEKKLFWKMVDSKNRCPSSCAKTLENIVEKLFSTSSLFIILPLVDALGLEARINTPNTTGTHNWSWRPNFTIEEINSFSPVMNRMEKLKKIIEKTRKK